MYHVMQDKKSFFNWVIIVLCVVLWTGGNWGVESKNIFSVIVSRDKDLMQALLNERDVWLDASKLSVLKILNFDVL